MPLWSTKHDSTGRVYECRGCGQRVRRDHAPIECDACGSAVRAVHAANAE